MPETQRVQELVLHGAQAVAVFADGEPLLAHTAVSHRGEAAVVQPETHGGVNSGDDEDMDGLHFLRSGVRPEEPFTPTEVINKMNRSIS